MNRICRLVETAEFFIEAVDVLTKGNCFFMPATAACAIANAVKGSIIS